MFFSFIFVHVEKKFLVRVQIQIPFIVYFLHVRVLEEFFVQDISRTGKVSLII